MGKVAFKPIAYNTVKKAKALAGVALLLLGVVVFLFMQVDKLEKQRDSISDKAKQYESLTTQVNNLNSSLNLKKEEFATKAALMSGLMNKDTFVTTITNIAQKNNIEIVVLSGGELESISESIDSISFKVELRGKINDINSFVEDFDNIGATVNTDSDGQSSLKYVVNDISFRKTDNFSWLIRETMDMQSGGWFDVAVSEMQIGSGNTNTISGIFSSSEMNLFMDVSFLSINAENIDLPTDEAE